MKTRRFVLSLLVMMMVVLSASLPERPAYAADNSSSRGLPPLALASPVTQLAVGQSHACALRSDGSVFCWGRNTYGEASPPTGVTFLQVDTGAYHTCGLRSDHSVDCWGSSSYGGTGEPAGTDFVQVASGYVNSCALRSNGTQVCWGWNDPVMLNVPAGSYKQITGGGVNYNCALKTDNSLACWGEDFYGNTHPPAGSDFTQIVVAGYQACAIKTDGSVVCWGSGAANPPAGSTFTHISAGLEYACGVKTDSSLICWGRSDSSGILSASPTGSGFTQVASDDGAVACALKNDGTFTCWGDNYDGQAPAINLSPAALPKGVYGQSYSQSITASGGTATPISLSVNGGPLPPGLSFDGTTLSGTPGQTGTFTIPLYALDNNRYFRRPTASLTINMGTSTSLQPDIASPVYGQPVALTATVTALGPGVPTGSVTFKDGATSLGTVNLNGSGQASLPARTFSVGSHSLTAVYTPSGYFDASQGAFNLTVSKANAAVGLTMMPNPSVYGQSVTLTANVSALAPGAGARTGTVSFYDGDPLNSANLLGSATLNGSGVATLTRATLATGSHSLTAVYAGDGNFNGGSSDPATLQTVNRADTSLSLALSANPVVYGQSLGLTIKIGALAPGAGTPTGWVNIATTDGGFHAMVNAAVGQYTLDLTGLPPNAYTLKATYPGDANFNPSADQSISLTVNRADTTVTLSASPNPAGQNQPVTFTAAVTAVTPGPVQPTGTVSFYDGALQIGSAPLVGGQATLTTALADQGAHTVTATYSGDTYFDPATSPAVIQTVQNLDLALTVTPSLNPALRGAALDYTFEVSSQGQDAAPGAVLSATLPAAFTVSDIPPSCALAGRQLTCPLGDLAAGARTSLVVQGSVPLAASGPLGLSAAVSSTLADAQPANNHVDLSTPINLNLTLIPDGSHWSSAATAQPPCGSPFLGEFGNQTVTLNYSNLPAHQNVVLSFDLYIIRSWDGNMTSAEDGVTIGPDTWEVRAKNSPTPLLRTTFSNWEYGSQAYPGAAPSGDYPSQTGAAAVNSLCYRFFDLPQSAVYHLNFSLPHTASDLAFDFSGSNLQSLADESWGLANVQITLSAEGSQPVVYLPSVRR